MNIISLLKQDKQVTLADHRVEGHLKEVGLTQIVALAEALHRITQVILIAIILEARLKRPDHIQAGIQAEVLGNHFMEMMIIVPAQIRNRK